MQTANIDKDLALTASSSVSSLGGAKGSGVFVKNTPDPFGLPWNSAGCGGGLLSAGEHGCVSASAGQRSIRSPPAA